MKVTLRSHNSLIVHFRILSLLGLLPLLLAVGLQSKGEKLAPPQSNRFDHIPIVMLAGDLKSHRNGKVIIIDPDTPHLLRRLPTGSIGPIAYVQWTEDHSCLLLTTLQGLFMVRYDSSRKSFTPPVAVANPGGDPSIEWPAVYRRRESDIEDALRLKVNQTLGAATCNTLAWSSDHSEIAFTIDSKDVADNAGEVYQDLWVAHADGLLLKRLGHGAHPHWCPTEHSLVAIDGSVFGGKSIVRYDSDSGKRTVLRTGQRDCFAAAVYSPSGTSIAVFGASDPAHEGSEGVFLMNTKGHVLRKLAAKVEIGSITYPLDLAW